MNLDERIHSLEGRIDNIEIVWLSSDPGAGRRRRMNLDERIHSLEALTPAVSGIPTASERGAKSEVAHKWAKWLPHPCRIGDPHRCRAGGKIRSGPQVGKVATSPLPYRGSPPLQRGGQKRKWPTSGQNGYLTPAVSGIPTASERGAKSEVAHNWAKWLPHPCRIGDPHRCRAAGKIRSGPQVGKVATSPRIDNIEIVWLPTPDPPTTTELSDKRLHGLENRVLQIERTAADNQESINQRDRPTTNITDAGEDAVRHMAGLMSPDDHQNFRMANRFIAQTVPYTGTPIITPTYPLALCLCRKYYHNQRPFAHSVKQGLVALLANLVTRLSHKITEMNGQLDRRGRLEICWWDVDLKSSLRIPRIGTLTHYILSGGAVEVGGNGYCSDSWIPSGDALTVDAHKITPSYTESLDRICFST